MVCCDFSGGQPVDVQRNMLAFLVGSGRNSGKIESGDSAGECEERSKRKL